MTVREGEVYDYCEDCGAGRRRSDRTLPGGGWHTCDLCRLPGASADCEHPS